MRTIPAALLTHLGLEVTSLAMCWEINRRDGQSFFYTDHDDDIELGGNTYVAETGFSRSAVEFSLNMAVDNSDLVGIFRSDQITEEAVLAGFFDDAEIRMRVVNWKDPTLGEVRMLRGWLGQLTRQDGVFTAEVRSLTQMLQANVCSLYTARCRSDFGDTGSGTSGGCRYVVPSTPAIVGVVSDRKTFAHDGGGVANTGGTKTGGYFALGTATVTTGANAGVAREIESDAAGVITLYQPVPFELEAGTAVTLRPGCDKTLEVCRDNYDNLVNYRGEPYVPGSDVLFKIQRAKSGDKK